MPEVKTKSGKVEEFAYTAKGKAAAAAVAAAKKAKSKSKSKMYPPVKGKKSLFEKMKAVAKKIPGTETNRRAKNNKNVATGIGRKPTYKDKD